MAGFIYNALDSIFGAGVINDLIDFMSKVLSAVNGVMSSSVVDILYTIFIGVACAMLIIYFYADLISQASKELFSLEKLVVAFMKCMVGFTLLLCVKDITSGMVMVAQATFDSMRSDSLTTQFTQAASEGFIFQFGGETYDTFPKWEDVKDDFEDEYSGLSGGLNGIGMVAVLFFPSILLMIAKGAGYFVCASVAIVFVVRCFLSPIAIVQCFEDGTRSAGIKYIKKLASLAITMGIIVLIIRVSGLITNQLFMDMFTNLNTNVIDFEKIDEVVSFKNIIFLILPDIVLIGAIIGSQVIADDVIGVRP